jgi:intracellular sulfur oxidation DsrE/DsrF family protein
MCHNARTRLNWTKTKIVPGKRKQRVFLSHESPIWRMQSVVHLISGDETEQETALAIAQNLLDDESGTIDDIAVVVQSEGIEAVTADGDNEEQVRSLLDEGVSFRACSNTLDMMGLDKSDLIGGVETVPEGAVEVTRLETEGYAYMRP